jgi:hypothetical protein
MAVLDALKLLKFNKLYKSVWELVWSMIGPPPSDDNQAEVNHLCFVGTLLYAVRYRVALFVGMSDSFSKSMAVVAVSKAGYDTGMEDEIYAVFSAEAGDEDRGYAANLYTLIDLIAGAVSSGVPCDQADVSARLDQLGADYAGRS